MKIILLFFFLFQLILFEAREKLSHRIFVDLNNDHFQNGYAYSGWYKTHLGYRVIGVDGSVLDVPAGAKYFGTLTTVGESVPKAQAVAFTDVMNDYILRAELKPYGCGETNMAKEMFQEFFETDNNPNNLFLFDRGFFSRDLARLLVHNSKFIFRVQKNSLKEFNRADKPDQIIIRRDKGKQNLRLRVINFTLPGGEVEKLVTNIFDESFTVNDFGKLYNLRWGIEVSFLTLKERLQIENFSSAKQELILQDFHAAIFVYNLMTAAITEAGEPSDTSPSGKKYKYKRKVNKNLAIPQIRDLIIVSFLCDNPIKRKALFERALASILHYTVPIRPGRSFPRTVKHKSAKFPINKKSGLA